MFKILFFLLIPAILFSQTTSQKFFDALISANENITEFINKDELAKSQRLGITYKDVDIKALLTYDIPPEIKQNIITGTYKYEIKEQTIGGIYTEAAFIVPEINYQKKYYFKNGFVFNSTYLTSSWQTKQGKYFNFRLLEPKYFNEYCIQRLDDFVEMMADTLGFTEDEKTLLEKEKIYYTFCTDEKEVEKITGFRSKGMALLANDEIVTAYQTHFHEVAHILINYKLKSLGLYTLPFFMEGFAVAMGGRGGMAPRVVTDVGAYLQTTGFLTYDSILTNEQFYNTDANMSYALSGLYNMFLFNELGAEKYLELYKSVNGNFDFVKSIRSENINLPASDAFKLYVEEYEKNNKGIVIEATDFEKPDNREGKITDREKYFEFCVQHSSSVRMKDGEIKRNYISRLFEQTAFSDYRGTQYYIKAEHKSVKIYNCYNDELIASFDRAFEVKSSDVPYKDRYYLFSALKSLFDFNLSMEGLLRAYEIDK